jgi:hypothetical protein
MGSPERAVQLFAWADTTRAAIGDTRLPIEQKRVDRDLTALDAQLNAGHFASAWSAGSRLTAEEAIALALGDTPAIV